MRDDRREAGAEVEDALAFALRTVASKFPQYRFEELLDKTPAWMQWTCLQAINLDRDMAKKMGILMGGDKAQPAGPRGPRGTGIKSDVAALKDLGIKVKRK